MKQLKSLSGNESVLLFIPDNALADHVGQLLANTSLQLHHCHTLAELNAQLGQASAAIICRETITAQPELLKQEIASNAAMWAEFPFLILVEHDEALRDSIDGIEEIGNMRLITKPVEGRDLGRALKSALLDHSRQCTIRDHVQQLEEKTRQLAHSQERWKVLTEAMPQLVWMCRPDGYCMYLSRQWEEFTGIASDKLSGYAWIEVLHPDDREDALCAWNNALAGTAEYDIEYRICRHDGVYRWFKARGVSTRNEHGEIEAWYGTCTDIQDMVDARTKAEESNLAKTEFLANMSHEIRTPMNAVVGLANILAGSAPLNAKQRECIETLQMSADSLLALINDMLDISKIEARSVELEEVPFSLHALMDEITCMMRIRAHEKGIDFRTEYADDYDAGAMSLGDPTRLRQVLLNLCSNAVKFTEAGHVLMQVGVAARGEHADTMQIVIRDTGIGIPAAQIDHIFEKFVQADSTINRKFGGTGLGLTISKTLAEMMGGDITVESILGRGSAFTVTVPLRRAHHADITPIEAARSRAASAAAPAKRRVLLVEDYPANILVATTFLEQFGYDYDVAANGREALERVGATEYDAVLMDVQMHEMNGLEATARIRAREREQSTPRLPIIGMTAHALAGDRERCIEAGMDDYLSKPFDPEELQRKLAEAMTRRAAAA